MTAVQLFPAEQLPEGGRVEKEVEGRKLLFVHHRGRYHAIDSQCFHMAGPLGSGDIEDGPDGDACVVCPWHKRVISLVTGSWVDTTLDGHDCSKHGQQRVYPTAVKDGWLWVKLPVDGSLAYESDKFTATTQARGGLNGQGMGLSGGLRQQPGMDAQNPFSGGLLPQPQQGIATFSRAFKPSARRAAARAALLKNYKPPPMAESSSPPASSPATPAPPPETPMPPSTPASVVANRAAGNGSAATMAGGGPSLGGGGPAPLPRPAVQRTLDSYFRPAAAVTGAPVTAPMAAAGGGDAMEE